jgi:hypothetical protein
MRIPIVIAILMLAVPVLASATPSTPDVVVHDMTTSGVLDYWTPERVAAMAVGDSTPGAPPENGPDGAPAPTGTVLDRTVGRLFFVDRGEDSSCTATVVRSANRRTAVTGAHCAHTRDLIGEDPRWVEKMLFVPGFRDNTRPFGSFPVTKVVLSRTWVNDDQQDEHDQAFLVVDKQIHDAQPIGFDLPANRPAREFGYPRAATRPGHQGRPEFTGQRLAQCWGTPKKNPGHPDAPQTNSWGVPCDMGGGASGGPRTAPDATGLDVVVGVNTQSFSLDAAGHYCDPGECTRHLGGPRFSWRITAPLHHRAESL